MSIGGGGGDAAFMDLALAAARRGDFRTSPNPMVGCLMVRDGAVVATGWHERAGAAHAEVMALRAAGDVRGADVFVTLEPCTLHGRTPPCVEALLAQPPARVVIAMLDPNPRVAGRGAGMLRAAGIEVTIGVREAEAEALNVFYTKHITTGFPFVTGKFAASLDGRIATASGESQWITSEESREMAHLLRHQHDAVLVGSGTILADNPRLTARVETARQPLRVVLDSRLRIPDHANVLAGARGSTLIATTEHAAPLRVTQLRDTGVRVEIFDEVDGRVDLRQVLQALGGRDVISVLIEGGPRVLGSAFDAGLVDRVVAMLAPRVIGGGSSPAAVAGQGVQTLAAAGLLDRVTVERCGPDIVVSGYCVGGDT